MAKKLTWKDVPLADKERLARMYVERVNLDGESAKLSMKRQSLERNIRNYLEYRAMFVGAKAGNIAIPESATKRYVDYPVAEGDDWLIISDIEIPDHDAVMLRLALLSAMSRGIKKLVINGDLIATDQSTLNEWTSTWVDSTESTYEDDVDVVRSILFQFSQWFDEIWITEGNHDDRVARATGGQVHLGMFLKDTIAQYTRYGYMYIKTSERGYIKCVHPQNFSKDPVTLGQKLYDVERGPVYNRFKPFETYSKTHFVVAHCHRQQSGFSPDGVFEIHSQGTMRDADRTKYKSKGANKHNQWDSGFIIVQNGHIYPMTLTGTDWEYELKELYKHSPLPDLMLAQ